MQINRLSGYERLTLASGQTVELKFCNGSTELFAKLMGITFLSEIGEALSCRVVNGKSEVTARYLKALRLYVFAAAKYVCLAENRPVDFNEWAASEWIDEVGVDAILSAVDLPEAPSPNEAQILSTENEIGTPQTIREYKTNALARLNLSPAAYYDLTPAETSALLNGTKDRENFSLWQTRRIAILLRNAHYKDPLTEQEYMPLPGDKYNKKSLLKSQYTDPEVAFMMLGSAMGGELTVEYHNN